MPKLSNSLALDSMDNWAQQIHITPIIKFGDWELVRRKDEQCLFLLAFMMGRHARLGSESPVNLLDDLVLCKVISHAGELGLPMGVDEMEEMYQRLQTVAPAKRQVTSHMCPLLH